MDMELTDGLGVDFAIEAVGLRETFELCPEAQLTAGEQDSETLAGAAV